MIPITNTPQRYIIKWKGRKRRGRERGEMKKKEKELGEPTARKGARRISRWRGSEDLRVL